MHDGRFGLEKLQPIDTKILDFFPISIFFSRIMYNLLQYEGEKNKEIARWKIWIIETSTYRQKKN